MSALGGLLQGCLLWGGVSAPGGSAPGGCLLQGGLLWRVSAPGGVCSGGWVGIPACTEADTHPPVDRHMPVKILPWPNFVAAGNYQNCSPADPRGLGPALP